MKKSELKLMIRKIVREEVALSIQEVIKEITEPSQQPVVEQKNIPEKSFTKNSILNEVMNETAATEEWKTLGGGTYDSSRMGEVMASQYQGIMNNNSSTAPVSVDGQTADFLNKDYSTLLKKVEEKAKTTRG